MIITKLHCGLGNQMFQYAAGLALANRHRTVQTLDVSWFRTYDGMAAHNQYGLNCFNVTEQFAAHEELSEIAKYQSSKHVAPVVDYYPSFADIPDNTYLDGFFQSERFFLAIHETVRNHFSFRFPPTAAVSRCAEFILSSAPSVCLHVRRGDYVALYQDRFGLLGRDYYRSAIQALKERYSGFTVFVFSDDIDSAEKELLLDVPHHFVRATEHYNFYDKIRLMSLCNHAIISNSTFAWWGAWLIPNKDKTIIAPKPWFTGEGLGQLQVVSDSWIQISRAPRDSFITPSIS
ncbi:MAG: alpha-1,2-fucosyltransferase [Proteobacteria bacterium]|nr:alpha-1,2-fucosyltransferase [Pseudomonadota bacterium]